MGRSRNALWVRPSIWLRGLRQKVEKCSTFQTAPDPSANQIAVMQINPTRFLDPFCNNKHEEAGKICPLYNFQEMWNNRIVFSHLLFGSSFVLISTPYITARFFLLNFLTQATEPNGRMDPQCISRAPHAKSMRSVDGRR